MLSWLPRRRARIENIAVEAEALVRALGEAAYGEARYREHEASSDEIARDWGLVALAVARLIGRSKDVDPSVRLAMNAVLVPDRKESASRKRRSLSEPRPADEAGAWSEIFDGSRDPGGGCVGSNRRRREYRVAASNDWIAHSRQRRLRSLWA